MPTDNYSAVFIDISGDNGVLKKTIREGKGPTAQVGDEIILHYSGILKNGIKFDSSIDKGKAVNLIVGSNSVIKDYAYGNRSIGTKIPPKSTLIFHIEVLDIITNPIIHNTNTKIIIENTSSNSSDQGENINHQQNHPQNQQQQSRQVNALQSPNYNLLSDSSYQTSVEEEYSSPYPSPIKLNNGNNCHNGNGNNGHISSSLKTRRPSYGSLNNVMATEMTSEKDVLHLLLQREISSLLFFSGLMQENTINTVIETSPSSSASAISSAIYDVILAIGLVSSNLFFEIFSNVILRIISQSSKQYTQISLLIGRSIKELQNIFECIPYLLLLLLLYISSKYTIKRTTNKGDVEVAVEVDYFINIIRLSICVTAMSAMMFLWIFVQRERRSRALSQTSFSGKHSHSHSNRTTPHGSREILVPHPQLRGVFIKQTLRLTNPFNVNVLVLLAVLSPALKAFFG
eukprot:gene3914-7806_t